MRIKLPGMVTALLGLGWRGAAVALVAIATAGIAPGSDAQPNDLAVSYIIPSVYYRSPDQTECTRGYPHIDVVLAIDASARASPQVSLASMLAWRNWMRNPPSFYNNCVSP